MNTYYSTVLNTQSNTAPLSQILSKTLPPKSPNILYSSPLRSHQLGQKQSQLMIIEASTLTATFARSLSTYC
jgi:hypothetical protein